MKIFQQLYGTIVTRNLLKTYNSRSFGNHLYQVTKQSVLLNHSLSRYNHSCKNKSMSDHIYPNDTPFSVLDANEAFLLLTREEQLYAHHFSKACWIGGLIVLLQTSVESPVIYILLHQLFRSQSIDELKKSALQSGITEEEFIAFLVYTSAFLAQMGNYKGMGDIKFIPNLPKESFQKLVLLSKLAEQNRPYVESLLSKCLEKMYSLKDDERYLGFPETATTTYLSKNTTKEDQTIVNDFLKRKNIEAYNSRLIKTLDETGNSCFEIRLASVLSSDCEDETKSQLISETINSHKFTITRGDYSKLLQLVNRQLLLAKEFAANENQKQMIANYVKSFHSGSLDAHKDGSRYWVKDKGPIVETYIGFIETYRDPAGMRGEFEGFVSMVNKPQSLKFSELVQSAEVFLPMLPWPQTYEKDVFLRPDFTSLDVLTFACSGIPAGICIPNYDSIRQCEGFKNVSLGNVLRVPPTRPPNFLSKADQDLRQKYMVGSMEVVVGLHELLGHGSGKMFCKQKDGSFNFEVGKVLHLETGQPISNWYEDGESYDSVFGSLGSPYEECRAESVGIYLATVPEILKIFGFEGSEAGDVTYVCWMLALHMGLTALQMYDPVSKNWLQAHCQAAFAMLQVCLEAGGGFVELKETTGEDGKPDLLFSMDRSKIESVGRVALGKFLQRLQLYRSTADEKAARAMFDGYTAVTSEGKYPFLSYREIVMARKKPRRLEILSNTLLENGEVKIKNYQCTPEDLIQSWIDRFEGEDLYKILEDLWTKDHAVFA